MERIMTPAQREELEIQVKAGKIHRENLRRSTETRIRKAEEKGDKTLLTQLQQELEELR
jgi:hypothetical protein